MILTQTKKNVEISDDFEQQSFSIQADAASFNILSNKVYTHKVRAVIRELSCNAYDSHIEAGNSDPIKIHLPNTLEPWFAVKDFGIGLSHEDCMDLYTTYFKSTKRDSNDVTGCLGIGSKSFYCLVDSASITSVFKGEKRIYTAFKDENDLPQMVCLSSEETEEPNGLEISMSVENRISEFSEEAVKVYQHFDVVPHINNKNVVTSIEEAKNRYTIRHDDFCVSSGYGNMYAVMGHVGYLIPSEYNDTCFSGVVKFDMGEIDFEAGRETLSMTDRTKAAVEAKIDKMKSTVKDIIIDNIESKPTVWERACEANEYNSEARRLNISLSEYHLPEPSEQYECFRLASSYSKTVDRDFLKHTSSVINSQIFLKESRFVNRIRQYVKDTGSRVVLLTNEQITEMKIPLSVVQKLDTLPKIDRTSRSQQCTHKVFEFDHTQLCYEAKDNWSASEIDTNDTTTEFVYVEIKRWQPEEPSWYSVRYMRDVIKESVNVLGGDIKVYGLKTAFLKTKRFKDMNFIKLSDYLKREVGKKISGKVYTFKKSNNMATKLVSLVNKCYDPIFDQFKSYYDLSEKTSNLIAKLGLTVEEDATCDSLYEEIYTKYPMLSFVDSWEMDTSSNSSTIVDYINERFETNE